MYVCKLVAKIVQGMRNTGFKHMHINWRGKMTCHAYTDAQVPILNDHTFSICSCVKRTCTLVGVVYSKFLDTDHTLTIRKDF